MDINSTEADELTIIQELRKKIWSLQMELRQINSLQQQGLYQSKVILLDEAKQEEEK